MPDNSLQRDLSYRQLCVKANFKLLSRGLMLRCGICRHEEASRRNIFRASEMADQPGPRYHLLCAILPCWGNISMRYF